MLFSGRALEVPSPRRAQARVTKTYDPVLVGSSVVNEVAKNAGEIQKYIEKQLKGASQALAYAQAGLKKMDAGKAAEKLGDDLAGKAEKVQKDIASKGDDVQKEVKKRVDKIVGKNGGVSFKKSSPAASNWKKFVPKCMSVSFAEADAGSKAETAQASNIGKTGGPCGKTPYKDFGKCLVKGDKCVAGKFGGAWAPKKCTPKSAVVEDLKNVQDSTYMGMDLPGQGMDGGYPIKKFETPFGAAFDPAASSGGEAVGMSSAPEGWDGGFPVGKYDGLNNEKKKDTANAVQSGKDYAAKGAQYAKEFVGKKAAQAEKYLKGNKQAQKYVKEFAGSNMAASEVQHRAPRRDPAARPRTLTLDPAKR